MSIKEFILAALISVSALWLIAFSIFLKVHGVVKDDDYDDSS